MLFIGGKGGGGGGLGLQRRVKFWSNGGGSRLLNL